MSDIIRLQKRGTDQFHEVTPAIWEKLKKQGKADFYEVVTAPAIPKEVAEKVALNKMSGPKTPESDNANTDKLPGKDAGQNT